MKTITLFLCIFFLFSADIQAQEVSNDSIQNLFLEQISLYPQEKIYVYTDKSSYVSGETIWLRVHLVDALLLKQANASRYVYVELINLLSAGLSPEINFRFEDKKVNAEISFMDKAEKRAVVPDSCRLFIDGSTKGEGESLSFEEESAHFSFDLTKAQNQPVFVLQTTYKGRTYNRFFAIPQPDDAFDVSFFPEGGHVTLQADIRIAFKALKKNGLHENVKGTIYDDTGQECASFGSGNLGMGQFRMHYLPGRTYYAVCTNEQNVSKRFGLPVPEPNTVALKAHWSDGNLRLTLSRSSDGMLPSGMHLVAHIRGAVLYSQPWNDKRGYLFEKDFFPAGIVHLLLIDKDRNILSERLVFSSQSSTFANLNVTPDKKSYQTRGKISLSIKVTDEYGAPLSGNFSLSVVDKRDVAIDTTSGILSTLLLTSELKGYIESPMSYLQKDERDSNAALDVLMMTQGWRRYNVPTENFDYSMLNVNDISDAFVSPATSVMPIFGTRAANGAIVINTKKGFVEKNSLNKNMQVITPIGYQQHVEFYSPAYETEEQRKNTAPDLRSTIYWNPCVRTDSTGIAHLSFYSADSPSQYGLVIEGVSSFGHLIYLSNEAVTVE